jgi:hypothetical protein
MIPGPAADIPEYLLALELLIVRGCTVHYDDGSRPGVMEAYTIHYPRQQGPKLTAARMLFSDPRGTKQALELLEELNAPPDTYDAMASRYSAALAKSLQATASAATAASLTLVFKTAWQEYEKEEK